MRFFLIVASIDMFLYTVVGNAQTKNLQGYKISSTGFFENKGQILDQNHKPNTDVKYLLCSPGFNIQLTKTGFNYDTYIDTFDGISGEKHNDTDFAIKSKFPQPKNFTRHYHRVNIELPGCNKDAQIIAEKKSAAYFNYLTAQKGVSDIHSYQKITYKNIYPNVDLEFFTPVSNHSAIPIEYQFIVHPGGNPGDIKLAYKGAIKTSLKDNKLVVKVNSGDFTESIPSSYLKGTEKQLKVGYIALGDNVYGFSFPTHKVLTTDLIIDPVPNLLWGTYYGDGGGADGDYSYAIAVDAAGNTYIAGRTQSTTNIATAGAYQSTFTGSQNAFAAKFNSTGSALLWGTYYGSGGGTGDQAFAIAIDAGDNVYIAGNTESTTGIATAGAYSTTFSGPNNDAFVAKINSTGTALVWGTYYGESQSTVFGIALDASANVYITGTATCAAGISTAGAYLTTYTGGIDAFAAELNSTGTALLWGTYYGGGRTGTEAYAIALDAGNNVYITGSTTATTGIATAGAYQTTLTSTSGNSNAFAAKFNSTGSALLWGTYYGGNINDWAYAIALDAGDNAYIAGVTQSTAGIATLGAYQTTLTCASGRFDAFVAKISSTGSALDWGTYYGGNVYGQAWGIALDASDNSYVTGLTQSTAGISTAGAYQAAFTGGLGGYNSFIAKFNPAGSSLLWGTYYGGTLWNQSYAIALGPCNNAYITGVTESTSDIATTNAYQTTYVSSGGGKDDAFVAEFDSTSSTTALTVTVSNSGVCNGGSTGTATTTATGGYSPYTYSWSPVGQTTVTATGLSAGIYTITVTDICGNSGTASTTITQPNPLAVTVSSTGSSCSGGNTGTATVTASGGNSPYTYSWNPGGQTNATATGLSAGTYTVTVMDICGSSASAATTITQANTLTSTTSSTGTSCIGGNTGTATVTASGGGSPYTYLWNPGGQTSITATGLSGGTYTITTTDNCGNSITASVTVTQTTILLTATTSSTGTSCSGANSGTASATASGGGSPYTYLWNPGGQTTLTATGLSIGTYTVTITDNCGNSITASIVVTQTTTPLTISSSNTGASCSGGNTGTASVAASGGGSPYTYLWNPGGQTNATATGLSVGTCTIIVTDNCGNSASNVTIITTTTNLPVINVTASKTTICSGSSVTLSATATNITTQPTWQPGALTGESITITPTVTTTYTVTALNACGSANATVTINVNYSPLPAFGSDVAAGCSPLCIQFYNQSTISSGRIASSLWDFGTGDTSSNSNPIYCYKNPGYYPVKITVTSDSGCSATLIVQNYVTVYNNPVAAFKVSPQPTTLLQPTIQFTDKSTDAYGIAEWNWNFGDEIDSGSILHNPTFTYEDTGTYCAHLAVTNIHGCVDTTTYCLIIYPFFSLYIPSAFSPNGDGLNDIFEAKGDYVKSFEMYIFDRWGMQLFHSTDIKNGWNGTLNGKICQEDAYGYIITVYDSKNTKHSYTGTVSLLK